MADLLWPISLLGGSATPANINGLAIALGLLPLADLTTVARRAALDSGSDISDIAIIPPGLHKQQNASELSRGEYPACGALTTGYVFRVENEATVYYLQSVGKTGHLVTLDVSTTARTTNNIGAFLHQFAVLLYFGAVTLLVQSRDWPALAFLLTLTIARVINVLIMRSRAQPGWYGAKEPGVKSDLLVLLSKDRWVRLEGLTDDMKAVTSGSWLRETTLAEDLLLSTATVAVHLNAGLALYATSRSQAVLLILILAQSVLLGLVNYNTLGLHMHGRTVRPVGSAVAYTRRLDLAKQLLHETQDRESLLFDRKQALKRTLIRMAVIQPDQADELEKMVDVEGSAIM